MYLFALIILTYEIISNINLGSINLEEIPSSVHWLDLWERERGEIEREREKAKTKKHQKAQKQTEEIDMAVVLYW